MKFLSHVSKSVRGTRHHWISCTTYLKLFMSIPDVVLVFTVPPLYEKYQTQIDTHYKLAREKIAIVLAAVKARIPGAKEKTQ